MSFSSVFAGALLALTTLAACKRAEPEPVTTSAAAAVKVRVATVETATTSPAIRVAGVLARQTEAELSFPVGGIVDRVLVRAGDRVAKNQELARLQTDQFEAQVIQAKAAVDKARRDLGRIEKLQTERVATLENLQDARTELDRAAAVLRIAEFNQRHSVIVAPSEGVVLRRLAEPSELVGAGRPVLSFANDGDGWIAKCGLTPRDAARVATGDRLEFADATGAVTGGKIVRLAEAVDPATGTVTVEATLDAPPTGARSGQIVSLSIAPKPVAARTVVPLAALRDGAGSRASVLVLDAGAHTAKRVAVEIEQVDGDRVYLRTTLPAQARVVVSGAQFVREGATLEVTAETAGATAR